MAPSDDEESQAESLLEVTPRTPRNGSERDPEWYNRPRNGRAGRRLIVVASVGLVLVFATSAVMWRHQGSKHVPQIQRRLPVSGTTNLWSLFGWPWWSTSSSPGPSPAPFPQPAPTPAPTALPLPTQGCICLFDVDRTLTAKQGVDGCPGVQLVPGVQDTAFGGGPLSLSQVGQNPRGGGCDGCKLGVISAGSAGLDDEKKAIELGLNLSIPMQSWSESGTITAPLVTGCVDARKPECADGIVKWYKDKENIEIPPNEVYFFDDSHGMNVHGFAQRGYNAHQVSCASRDASMNGAVGLCGATANEVSKKKGTSMCI